MFFEKLYNLIYHIGFTAGSGFMKFGKWLSRGLSRKNSRSGIFCRVSCD